MTGDKEWSRSALWWPLCPEIAARGWLPRPNLTSADYFDRVLDLLGGSGTSTALRAAGGRKLRSRDKFGKAGAV